MFIAVLILHVVVSLTLIAIILLQAGRGGLSESFGGGPTQSLFGTQTATFLTRTTTACAILFFCTCLTLAVLSSQRGRSLMEQVPGPGIPTPEGLANVLGAASPRSVPVKPATSPAPTPTAATAVPAAPAAAPQTAQDHPPTQ